VLLLVNHTVETDLKMYSSSRKELERMIGMLSDVSGEVGLQFCAEHLCY